MVEGSKQVRVDNWGIFFLQRLQMFFSKTDYCDLTLQFEGNVQLKVHRLVMNACTEYFTFLEQTCPAIEEGTIMMPPDLQADVIVPIVNFMYTGMLEFHMSIFEKLYKAAEIMNITVLMKLLDAQNSPLLFKTPKKKVEKDVSIPYRKPSKTPSTSELPQTLPGRKLPVWKRTGIQHPITPVFFPEKHNLDSLLNHDNIPKPTRFEWPEEDLPPVNMMDNSFENISYTSKPLLTQEEETRVIPNVIKEKTSSNGPARKDVKEPKSKVQQKNDSSDTLLFDIEEYSDSGVKRKADLSFVKPTQKRIKINDKENSKEATISVKSKNLELDHTKIVTEILKKYPNLVKKNKNIKLKIMPVSPDSRSTPEKKNQISTNAVKRIVQVESELPKPEVKEVITKSKKKKEPTNLDGPWLCHKCGDEGELPEFVLYYLYRKHMTDIHNEVFDIRLCKYCGQRCNKHNLMMYHLYTKHGLKPPPSYLFPKCDQCPYIALSGVKLTVHKQKHGPDEMQCPHCKLAFTGQTTLTAHFQITGHFNKPGRQTHDCQYCMKKLQSPINLLSHIKNSHLKDARKDGIVSLDEMGELNEGGEEDEAEHESDEEHVLSELSESGLQKDKVKIISNVKVSNKKNQAAPGTSQSQMIPIGSNPEALNNVTGSIATSLGLVDIVVLDENQQYILQQNNQTDQTEFILPELASGGNPFSGQVITTQHNTVIPQGMLQASSEISSTDELVMVLTDHDYQDEHEEQNTNNSNIVVLYSHPVDGEQEQFITSQGNLMMNSQTGMLEIRDGTTITTSIGNQTVVSAAVESPIESIEMIQREIDSQPALKQETLCEEQAKSSTQHSQSKDQPEPSGSSQNADENQADENQADENQADENQETNEAESQEDDRFEEGETSERDETQEICSEENQKNEGSTKTKEVEKVMLNQNVVMDNEGSVRPETNEDQHKTEGDQTTENHEVELPEQNVKLDKQDSVDGHKEEPMEIEEILESDVHVPDELKETDDVQRVESEKDEEVEETDKLRGSLEEPRPIPADGVDVPPDQERTSKMSPENQQSTCDDIPLGDVESPQILNDVESTEILNDVETNVGSRDSQDESMEVDGTVKVSDAEEAKVDDIDENTAEKENNKTTGEPGDTSEHDNLEEEKEEPSGEENIHNDATEHLEDQTNLEKDKNTEAISKPEETSDASISQENADINKVILEDWEEDTDSQQSEKQKSTTDKQAGNPDESEVDEQAGERQQRAAENVNELMYDWDEEDEEEKRDT